MLRALSLLVVLAAVAPSTSGAQTFLVGRLPTGIRIEVDHEPYAVEASSADGILQQLRLHGPGGGWYSFPFFFRWDVRYEELPLALQPNQGSRFCRVERFEADVDFQAVYPVWQAPPDAAGELVEAWAAFQLLVQEQWDRRRSAMLGFFTELGRAVRRVEAGCGLIHVDVQRLVDERLEEFNEAEEVAYQAPEARLPWPPPGFAERLAARPGVEPEPIPEPPTDAAPAAASPDASPVDALPLDISGVVAAPPEAPAHTEAARFDASASPAGTLPFGPTEYRGPNSLDAAVDRDFARGTGGLVVGLIHRGELRYLDAVDDGSGTPGDTLTIHSQTEFSGLTPVLVTALVSALASRGVLDLGAPISHYLPAVDPAVGRVTLEQLLSHRSGIDSAAPREDESWEEATSALDAHAFFTEPDVVFSRSPYNDLLIVEVVEAVLRMPISEALERALLGPLGMNGTSIGGRVGGMPVTTTTAVDVFQFLITWTNGQLSGMPELPRIVETDAAAAEARRVLHGGVWYDHVAGHPRVSLTCAQVGFRLFPATSTVFVAWGRRGWPSITSSFLLHELGIELGIGGEILRPTEIMGAAQTAPDVGCPEPEGLRLLVTRAGPDAPAADWAGRYTNGDQFFDLAERDGLLKVPGENMLDVGHYGGDVYFGSLRGRPILYLRLHRDAAGRRYVILGDRAYIRDEDRPTP